MNCAEYRQCAHTGPGFLSKHEVAGCLGWPSWHHDEYDGLHMQNSTRVARKGAERGRLRWALLTVKSGRAATQKSLFLPAPLASLQIISPLSDQSADSFVIPDRLQDGVPPRGRAARALPRSRHLQTARRIHRRVPERRLGKPAAHMHPHHYADQFLR